jgi:hypothetical protein
MTQKTFGSALAVAALCAAGLSAQAQTPQPRDDMRQDEARRTVTVVGCVQEDASANNDEFLLVNARPAAGEAGAVGTSGTMTPPPTTDPTTDPATDPTIDPTSPPPTDTTDRAAAYGTMRPDAGAEAREYELTGDREADLKSLVGKRVEIIGTLEEDEAGRDDARDPVAHGAPSPDAAGPGSTDRPTATETVGTSGRMADRIDDNRDRPRLKVASFRELPGSCIPAGDEPDPR